MPKYLLRYYLFIASKPFFGFGWIETNIIKYCKSSRRQLLNPSSASAGLKRLTIVFLAFIIVLLNPSSASAGLKLSVGVNGFNFAYQASKPFFGFGWIETWRYGCCISKQLPSKPFFGFGWIETFLAAENKPEYVILLNPSSASAGLKRLGVRASPNWYFLLNPSSASAGLKLCSIKRMIYCFHSF